MGGSGEKARRRSACTETGGMYSLPGELDKILK